MKDKEIADSRFVYPVAGLSIVIWVWEARIQLRVFVRADGSVAPHKLKNLMKKLGVWRGKYPAVWSTGLWEFVLCEHQGRYYYDVYPLFLLEA